MLSVSSVEFRGLTNRWLLSSVSSSSLARFSSTSRTIPRVLVIVVEFSFSFSLSDSPPGRTLRLQTGQKRLFLSSHLSMHSMWYTCSQGNRRILTPSSYSFKQIGHVSYLSVFWYFLVGILRRADLGTRFLRTL